MITLNTTLNHMLSTGNDGQKLSRIALDIANMVEAEAHMILLKNGKDIPKWQRKITIAQSAGVKSKTLTLFKKNLRTATNAEEWVPAVKVNKNCTEDVMLVF